MVIPETTDMGRHKEWRKIAKRERRRRIRTALAKMKGKFSIPEPEDFEEYSKWLKEQQEFEKFEIEQIERRNKEENDKWIQAETLAQERWRRLQEHKEFLRRQHLDKEAQKQMEWQQEQEKKRKQEERLKAIEEENKRKQEIFMKHLEEFLSGDSAEPPTELVVNRETRPDCVPCPFFVKTSCCRFGDQCSRNHKYPGISKVLLIQNFFSHFGFENSNNNEYDTDLMLEYEDSDTYKEFKDFFYDILPEFEKFGKVVQLKVCKNLEKHLRGNTYVEYAELRCAVAAYRALHSRWYGGKQISVQFCNIDSWFNAICGLASNKKCPFGNACNFLHVFRNPNNLFNIGSRNSRRLQTQTTPRQSWRWSESPEVELPERRSRSPERKRTTRGSRKSPPYRRRRSRSRERRGRSRERRKRSQSPERSQKTRTNSSERRIDVSTRRKIRDRSHSKERRKRSPSKERCGTSNGRPASKSSRSSTRYLNRHRKRSSSSSSSSSF